MLTMLSSVKFGSLELVGNTGLEKLVLVQQEAGPVTTCPGTSRSPRSRCRACSMSAPAPQP
jgi:hypothetical protein